MPFDPTLAAIRFGTGLSPRIAPPATPGAMMRRLLGPDEAAERLPIARYAEARPSVAEFNALTRERRAARGRAREEAGAALAALRGATERVRIGDARALLLRHATAEDALRERLALFWANHFTATSKNLIGRHLVQPFVEEAIRPHVAGRFADMLVAVETHPVMLAYLDQSLSFGPASRAGARSGRGLNENLARELLELHTVGVDGPYDQGDVRELAELLTGLTAQDGALVFRAERAEPGAETVLGATYAAEAGLASVEAALRGIAAHPATARHVARKLAAHFVADDPDADLVAALEATFARTGGDLSMVTATLLDHPAAWEPPRRKVKPPFDFLASALRALGVGEAALAGWDDREVRRSVLNPLGVMGQPWQRPGGPDGWPEAAEAWVTPQFVAARIDWSLNRPEEIVPDLPDPRAFVEAALGPAASEEVAFAARAAEKRSDGVGCVLASADFNRR